MSVSHNFGGFTYFPNALYTRAAHISDCHMYYGYGWSKKLKAPTDFGFALKNPIIQTKNKNISYFCCETEELFNRWVAVVRTVKYGSILRHNFKYVSNESGKDRIFQIKEGHDRRLHPEKFKNKISDSNQNSTLNTGNFSSNNNGNASGNHGNAVPQRHQHSQNQQSQQTYDSMHSTQTRQTHLSGTSTDFSQSNQSNQSQAYLAGQAYARRLQSQQNQQFAAPMTQFYEQGQSRNVGAVNDFPPPPPFVHQLENVFQNAKENSQVNRMNHPSSGSRNSYNSDMSQGQIGLNSNGSNGHNGSSLGHGSPHRMNQTGVNQNGINQNPHQYSQNTHQFTQNSTNQTNINLNITNQPVFNLNSTLTRQASAKLNMFDQDETFDSEEDDFEHKLDAMGTLESSVFNPGTVLRQTSYRSEHKPIEDFQSELARKLGGTSTLQRSNINGTVAKQGRNELFPPPPPFEPPPVPQNFTNKPPPPPRRR